MEGVCDYSSCRILYQLKLIEGFVSEAKDKGISVINAGSDQAANENFSGIRCDGVAEVNNVA